MRELSIESNLAGFGQRKQRKLIEHIRQPLALPFIRCIQTPKRILDRFFAESRLGSQWHLGHVHHRRPHVEVRSKLIVQVQTHHRLALHAIRRLVLQRNTDRRATGDNAFIQYGNTTGSIIHRVIHILCQSSTSSRNLHRTTCHIRRS